MRPALIMALVAASTVCAQVDLTPIATTNELDGVKQTYVVFRDGGRELSYYPPQSWRLNGSGPKLTLVPNTGRNTEAQIKVESVATVIPIGDASVSKYVAAAQQSVPRDARNLEVLNSRVNPLKICGHDTLAVDLQYDAYGATYRSHVLYLNRDREQWIFQFTAPANTFDHAFEPFRTSLYSLTGL